MTYQQHTLFVPGRLCLSGEHSDWAGSTRTINPTITPGIALTICFQHQGLYANTNKNSHTLSLSSPQYEKTHISISSLHSHALSKSPWRYASGVAYILHTRYNPNGSISLNITESTLPPGKGFSSSAALSVLVARAYSHVYDLNLSCTEEMDLAYAGERLTGSACGRMDQVVAHAPGTVACMYFDGETVTTEVVNVGRYGNEIVYLVVADLAGKKDTVEILNALQKGFANGTQQADKRLLYALGESNRSIVEEMKMALEKSDARKLGTLMIQAQHCFDKAAVPLCPGQLKAPRLHQVLEDDQIQALVYGGKGVGSQGDGAVQFVAKDEKCAQELKSVLSRKLGTEVYVIALDQSH